MAFPTVWAIARLSRQHCCRRPSDRSGMLYPNSVQSYPRSCGPEGGWWSFVPGGVLGCSWENPLSIEAKSPQSTAHRSYQTIRKLIAFNKALSSTRQISRSDFVLEPFSTSSALVARRTVWSVLVKVAARTIEAFINRLTAEPQLRALELSL